MPTGLGYEEKEIKKFRSGYRFSQPRLERFQKKLKNVMLVLFLAELGRDRTRNREKNFRFKFRSYSTQARAFAKKIV